MTPLRITCATTDTDSLEFTEIADMGKGPLVELEIDEPSQGVSGIVGFINLDITRVRHCRDWLTRWLTENDINEPDPPILPIMLMRETLALLRAAPFAPDPHQTSPMEWAEWCEQETRRVRNAIDLLASIDKGASK